MESVANLVILRYPPKALAQVVSQWPSRAPAKRRSVATTTKTGPFLYLTYLPPLENIKSPLNSGINISKEAHLVPKLQVGVNPSPNLFFVLLLKNSWNFFFFWFLGEGRKRNQISVGSCSEVSLPGKVTDQDIRSLNASIQSPSGLEEPVFLKRLPNGNLGKWNKEGEDLYVHVMLAENKF